MCIYVYLYNDNQNNIYIIYFTVQYDENLVI